MNKEIKQLIVNSTAFKNGEPIPKKYTCDGEDINPPLTINGTPEQAKSLTLMVEDPDAPSGLWIHWVVWNIPATTNSILENSVPGIEGLNTSRHHSYGGPCPPSGTHRYFFKIQALDTKLDLRDSSTKKDVEKAVLGHVIAMGELMGIYTRKY